MVAGLTMIYGIHPLSCPSKSGTKHYGKLEDKPCWFPNEIDWETFEGPSLSSAKDLKKILATLFDHYGLDGHTQMMVQNHTKPSYKNNKVTGKKTRKELSSYESFLRKTPEERLKEIKERRKRKYQGEQHYCLVCEAATEVGTIFQNRCVNIQKHFISVYHVGRNM